MRDAVICEPVRTPVGRYGGVFRDVPAAELAAAVVTEVLARTGVPPEQIDDVLLGQCYPNGEAPGIGRVAALDAGLPVSVTGYQLDRRCGSGLQSVINAAMQVQTGASEIVLAGGVESMSQAEYYTTAMRWGARAEHVHDVRPARSGPGDGRGRPPPCSRRHDRNGGEPAPRVPDLPCRAGRVRPAFAPAGRRRPAEGHLRRRDRPGHRPRAPGGCSGGHR